MFGHPVAIKVEEGFLVVLANEFSLVVLDSRLPDTTGLALAERMEGLVGETDPMPILLMTLTTERYDTERLLPLGIRGRLVKPIMPKHLARALKRLRRGTLVTSQEDVDTGVHRPMVVQSMRVLLVEDNVVNAEVAKETLEVVGHRVIPVDNGLKALAALEELKFDVILMDIHLATHRSRGRPCRGPRPSSTGSAPTSNCGS